MAITEYSPAAYQLAQLPRHVERVEMVLPKVFSDANGFWFYKSGGQVRAYASDGQDLVRSLRRYRLALLAARYGKSGFRDEYAWHNTNEYV
jgi:hypothetical protein